MIELKHVSKTYRSKKSGNTKALNDVSIKFDDKGMTFILGKSGSGKSTLLNVIGGLDKYDSGDMLILNKSSKDFKEADFDSYRNTYIGFVFQEFNILEDYDVYQNIVLALQLQKRKVDENEVDKILKKLDLENLKHRKVNELSGGQKQRVAIARALIKNPKIILADEPTGNLDSETGKQVINLLKEISKEKLVIIVSHDTDFANKYADRIIEVKDGSVINDTKKDSSASETTNEYKTIKSKLPLKESFKLGIGSLKHKKIKLFFTILLTMCTLLFFSFIDTISNYDVEKAHAKLLEEENEQFVQIERYKENNPDAFFILKERQDFKEGDYDLIKSKTNSNLYPVYSFFSEGGSSDIYNVLQVKQKEENSTYYGMQPNIEIIATNNVNDILKEDITGKVPNNYDEIVISNYFADYIIQNGIKTYEDKSDDEFMIEKLYKPTSYEELVNSNRTFYFGGKGKVKIVGVINYDLSSYQILKESNNNDAFLENSDKLSELNKKASNIYNKIYVNEDFVQKLETDKITSLKFNKAYKVSSSSLKLREDEYFTTSKILDEDIEYFDGKVWKKINNLAKNEMIINVNELKDFSEEEYVKALQNYLKKNEEEDPEVLEKRFFVNYIKDYNIFDKEVSLNIYESDDYNKEKPNYKFDNIKVVGITKYDSSDHFNYFSKDLLEKFRNQSFTKTSYLVSLTTKEEFKEVLDSFPYNAELSAKTTYSVDVEALVSSIKILKNIAFYVSIILLVFTVFLIGNFVINSIHYRKKEIGVLRALGSRKMDIVKIFLWESLTLSFMSATLAFILLVFVTNLLNDVIMAGTPLVLTPFILGIRQFVIIYLVVFVVAIISSVIPIIKISKMKPIDAILNK